MLFRSELINVWNEYLATSNAILNQSRKRELCYEVNLLIEKACNRIEQMKAKEKALLAHVSVYAPINPMLTGLQAKDDEIARLTVDNEIKAGEISHLNGILDGLL